jgi:hypothetical protein
MKPLLVALIVLWAVPLSAEAPVEVRVSPYNGFAPLTVEARITVLPHYQNWSICLQWDSGDSAGRACWDLNGQYAPRTQYYTIKGLGPGEYTIHAIVYQLRGVKISNPQIVRVLDSMS